MLKDRHQALITRIRRNCDVSDARHAGFFSICGLALRLRDLYKWETRLDPWAERDSAQIIDWIDARERHWEAIADEGYAELTVEGDTALVTPGKAY